MRVTTAPFTGAAALNVTIPIDVALPVTELGDSVRLLTVWPKLAGVSASMASSTKARNKGRSQWQREPEGYKEEGRSIFSMWVSASTGG